MSGYYLDYAGMRGRYLGAECTVLATGVTEGNRPKWEVSYRTAGGEARGWIIESMGTMAGPHEKSPFFDNEHASSVAAFVADANGCDMYVPLGNATAGASRCNEYYVGATAECWYDPEADSVDDDEGTAVRWDRPAVPWFWPLAAVVCGAVMCLPCIVCGVVWYAPCCRDADGNRKYVVETPQPSEPGSNATPDAFFLFVRRRRPGEDTRGRRWGPAPSEEAKGAHGNSKRSNTEVDAATIELTRTELKAEAQKLKAKHVACEIALREVQQAVRDQAAAGDGGGAAASDVAVEIAEA